MRTGMYVYEEKDGLDGRDSETVAEGGNGVGFSRTVEGDTNLGVSLSMVEAELHQHIAFDMAQQCFDSNAPDPVVLSYEDMGFNHQQQQQQQQRAAYPPEAAAVHLLNPFQLPRCGPSSLLPYDPLFHLNPSPQPPPVFRELFQSLPHGYNYNLPASRVNEREGSGGYGDGDHDHDHDHSQFDNGVLKFTSKGRGGKGTKAFASEKQRRDQLNNMFGALKSLVPNPTKNDRASVVGDAIEYIRELLRTVNELKLLVDKKRRGRERRKRQKTDDDINCSGGGIKSEAVDQSYNDESLIRSSWLQRKSKDTEVDVRIVDDEVTIKLVQRKSINCLLLVVSKILDELQLDLHHAAGGHVGDYCSFLFNTKICSGSSVYASAIANKLIQVLVDINTLH